MTPKGERMLIRHRGKASLRQVRSVGGSDSEAIDPPCSSRTMTVCDTLG